MRLLVNKGKYTVISMDESETFEFTDSDTAASKLEALGVRDEAIDEAFKDLVLKRNNEAHFGIEGTFMFTDRLKGK